MPAAMTPTARLEAVIRLERVDRVPVAPVIDYFAATFTGLTPHDCLFYPEKQQAAVEETFDRLGGWDVTMHVFSTAWTLSLITPLKVKLPGVELPADSTHQFVEEPVMTVDDYDFIVDKGYRAFLEELALRINPGIDREEALARQKQALDVMKTSAEAWAARGIPVLMGGSAGGAYGRFSYARSINEFIFDVHRRPEKVKAAIAVATPEIIQSAKSQVEYTGVTRVLIGASRESNAFISPKHFAEFVFPSLKETVDALVEAGITPLLHFDQDWSGNLPYLKQLPARKCILELDGWTDMFKAKEVLGDQMCLMGDVPPTLLTLGTPEEVNAYCKRLIDVVGEGSGFILSSGCSVPINAKPENVRAMIDTAKTYLPR